MFDIDPARARFAKSYGADAGIVMPEHGPATEPLASAQEYAAEVIRQQELGTGFDVAVEASGAEICAQMAVCILKAGGTCKCLLSRWEVAVAKGLCDGTGIQAGLGKPLTAIPLLLLTAKELNIKGALPL